MRWYNRGVLTCVHTLGDGGGVHEVAEAEDANEVGVELRQADAHSPRAQLSQGRVS